MDVDEAGDAGSAAGGGFETETETLEEEEGWELLAENFRSHFEAHEDLNEWGEEDPPSVETGSTLLWQLPQAPLGQENLGAFGPNGPPMNVMDCCPASGRVFVVNQRTLVGYSLTSLCRLAGEGHADERGEAPATAVDSDEWRCERRSLLRAQANRLRCGQIAGRPVVAVVDALGGVTIIPASANDLEPVVLAQNRAADIGIPTSTWGLALEPHGERPAEEGAAGVVAVSSNDHCVKAWTVLPATRCSEAASWPALPSGRAPLSSAPERWPLFGTGAHGAAPRLLIPHSNNIPSVDIAGGRIIAASLDGSVSLMLLDGLLRQPGPSTGPAGSSSSPASASSPAVAQPSAEPQLAGAATTEDSTPSIAGGAGTVPVPAAPHGADSARRRHIDNHMWGACWVPLKSIQSVAAGGPATPKLGRVEWTAGSVTLPVEVISTSLLPMFSLADLFGLIQVLSPTHMPMAEAEATASHRQEFAALVLSEGCVWLLDSGLRERCRARLPFDATFAHMLYAPDISTAVVAAKFETSPQMVWSITVLRRRGSLRLRMHIWPVQHGGPGEAGPGSSMIVGMAAAPGGRLLTLLANRRLSCQRLTVKAAVG